MSSSAMLFVGQQCADKHCFLVDFLPFKCQHCSQSYCQDHFRPTDHQCEKYDASKHDRVAPSCPICNEPVAIPQNQDPNVKMTYHIERECGKDKAAISRTPRCANGKCNKVLYSPIKCDTCHKQFCPEHRFPSSHRCTPETKATLPAAGRGATAGSKPQGNIKQAVETGSARATAGMAAIKRAMASPPTVSKLNQKAAAQSSSAGSNTKSNTSHANPFSKADRWVVKPIETSPSSHVTTTTSPPTTLPGPAEITYTPRSPTATSSPSTCKSDARTPYLAQTSYHPPPLFAH